MQNESGGMEGLGWKVWDGSRLLPRDAAQIWSKYMQHGTLVEVELRHLACRKVDSVRCKRGQNVKMGCIAFCAMPEYQAGLEADLWQFCSSRTSVIHRDHIL